jgi:hypothetical protein
MYTPAFSSNGQKLATDANNDSVTIWDTKTGKLLHELVAPARYFNGGIVFSPDARLKIHRQFLKSILLRMGLYWC